MIHWNWIRNVWSVWQHNEFAINSWHNVYLFLFSFVAKNSPANHWNVMNKMNAKSDQQHANIFALGVNGKVHYTKVILETRCFPHRRFIIPFAFCISQLPNMKQIVHTQRNQVLKWCWRFKLLMLHNQKTRNCSTSSSNYLVMKRSYSMVRLINFFDFNSILSAFYWQIYKWNHIAPMNTYTSYFMKRLAFPRSIINGWLNRESITGSVIHTLSMNDRLLIRYDGFRNYFEVNDLKKFSYLFS